MAKTLSDAVLDGALDIIATGTILTVCSTQPTNRTEAITTYKLADVVIDGSDFTKAAAAGGGRQITVGAQSGFLIDTSGAADWVAICDGTNLILTTTGDGQALVANASNTVSTPAFKVTIGDPT